MRYQVILNLYCNDFMHYTFQAYASTAQAAINKVRKQARREGFNELNSQGQISVRKRKCREYDTNYYYFGLVSAWK